MEKHPQTQINQGLTRDCKPLRKRKRGEKTIGLKYYSSATAGLWKCSKIGTLWGKMGRIFALVVVGDYGNTTNGKMKNRKCG